MPLATRPTNLAALAPIEGADAISIYADGGPNHLAVRPERLALLRGLMHRGVSLGCAHYAVEVTPERGGAEWKEWIVAFKVGCFG